MIEPSPSTPKDPDATLKPPQFSLRTLLFGTTAFALLIVLLSAVGAGWALAILLFASLVTAHVLGNSLGTRLRDGAAHRPIARAAPSGPLRVGRPKPPPTRLYEHRRLHWINLLLTLSGALLAGYFGGRALAATYPEATTAAHVLAYVSSGVLGGFAVFALSSFLTVLRQAISEAHAGSDATRPRRAEPNQARATKRN